MATGRHWSPTSAYDVNFTWNDSYQAEVVTADPMEGFPYPSLYSWTRIVLASMIVTMIMMAIVVGNALVVVAIAVDRRLKGVQHWFIGSLAVSDLLVGLFIMPFSLANEVMGYWAFGDIICQLWLSTDVLLCTASILNLCLISLDRYWSITRPIDYVRGRTPRRAALMISVVWTLSMVISLPPLVGWKRPQPMHLGFPLCQLSSELGYVLYSTVGSFYVPLLVMVLVYFKIYLAARARARRNLKSTGPRGTDTAAVTMVPTSTYVADADQRVPVVQVELESSDEFERDEEKFINSLSPEVAETGMETGTATASIEEQRPMLTAVRNNDDPEKHDLQDDSESVGRHHQLAVEYHAVDEDYAGSERDSRRSRSRGDDVITVDSADCLLPSTPRSITAVNAQRRAEFFGLTPAAGDHSDQVISSHLDSTTTSSAVVTDGTCRKSSDARSFRQTRLLVMTPSCEDALAVPRQSLIIDQQQRSKRKLARARERRATLILGIVMASFIGCWLPFFSIYPLSMLFDLDVPGGLFAVIFWLGYCNSALNPVIYTIFNREFRAAFVSILCRRRRPAKNGGHRRTGQTSSYI